LKNSHFFVVAGLSLALCTLVLTGCSEKLFKPSPDARLVKTWENGDKATLSGLYKTFTINKDYSFTASINPAFIEAVADVKNKSQGQITTDEAAIGAVRASLEGAATQAQITVDALIDSWAWQVTGTLIIDEGDIYRMDSLAETSGASVNPQDPSKGKANDAIGFYNKELVKITFTSDTAFTFESAPGNKKITDYFGGTYRVKL
jgi:hypothetical protein